MTDDPKKDDEKRDEVLKRMLGTKPAHEREPGKPSPRRISKDQVNDRAKPFKAGGDIDLDADPKG